MVGYEKTIYYACRYIAENLSQIDKLNGVSHSIDLKALKGAFEEFNKLMDKIKLEQAKKTNANKKAREQKKPDRIRRSDYEPPSSRVPDSDEDMEDTDNPTVPSSNISQPTRQKINMAVSTTDRTSNRLKPLKSKVQKAGKAKTTRRL
jgi:hypothetical protein